ncbi:MAG TPA: hypothetical protein VMI54_11675 [Polyangiaceae bacterium]|nr:hypothetical protein [Polyangiaceae bacterium]
MAEARWSFGVRISALALFAFAGGAGLAAYEEFSRPKPPPAVVPKAKPKPKPAATTIADPIAPNRAPHLDPTREAASGDWVRAHPAFQYSRSTAQRGGVNPCALPDADTSAFEPWTNLAKGHFTLPPGAVEPNGDFDLVMHFHGDDLARRELALSGQKFVLYGLTLDASESYAGLFAGSKLMAQLVTAIEAVVGAKRGTAAHARHIALTAWSAGYMAVLSILVQPEAKDVDAVALIDGLHGQRGALEHQLAPFVDFARRAETGERFMFLSHSSIDPPAFASTTETVHYVLAALGDKPTAVRRDDRGGLELVDYFSRGSFNARGYAGNDKEDHCAQVMLLRDVFAAIGRRWQAH